ncbi:MAG: adenine deaminase [Clostridia bacterium]|nr:adenine deaminase [Deltaproteobacteria bacterium]
MTVSVERLARRIDAAQGRIPCDVILKNARFLDVFACTVREGDIGIIDGTIVATLPGLSGRRVIDCAGDTLVPGFIDAHVHLESSLVLPESFERLVLPRGTTTVIADPHEIANVHGVKGLQYFLDAAASMHLDMRVMMSSCVPATIYETNGGGEIDAQALATLALHHKALGLAEMMNFPGVLHNDPGVLAKLEAFSGRVIDGHAPLVTGRALEAYAAAGISSCHESSQLNEAKEKLGLGISVWIREGSVAKDADTLASLLTLATSTSVGFCTDDRNPLDIAREGHLDHVLRKVLAKGVDPSVAYRAASWTVARHYGLKSLGAIAPGYRADIVQLGDYTTATVKDTFVKGTNVTELDSVKSIKADDRNSIRITIPEAHDLEGPSGLVHVIDVIPGKIVTGRSVAQSNATGIHRLTVLERHGHHRAPANAYVRGFGDAFRGAIASSVGHDSHNLIVVGFSTKDMRFALAALADTGGGFCVVKDGRVAALLALPVAGLMTNASPEQVERDLTNLRKASHAAGCALEEPFLQLAFLSLPVIPSLKLTDHGLFDVDAFNVIGVQAA